MNPTNKTKPKNQSGCGFLTVTIGMLICLLLFNAWIVRTYGASTFLAIDGRVFQAAQFVLPVLMIFVELWIYDMVFTNRQLGRKSD